MRFGNNPPSGIDNRDQLQDCLVSPKFAHSSMNPISAVHEVPGSTVPMNLFEQTSPTSSSSSLQTPQSFTFSLEHEHPHPTVPSTFLPSYYPDSRDRMPLLPSQRDGPRRTSHTPADVDRISASGPGSRHLLDGVALGMSPPRPSRPTIATPTYDISPTAYTRSLPRGHAAMEQKRGEWNDLPFEIEGGGGSHAPHSKPSAHSAPASVQGNAMADGNNAYSSSSPGQHGNGRTSAAGYDNGGAGQRSYPPHHPSESHHLGYPEMMFGNVQMPDGPMAWNTSESKVSGEDYAKALKIYEQLHSSIPYIRPLSNPAPTTPGQEYENLLRLAQDGIAAVTGQQLPVSIVKLPSAADTPRSSSTIGQLGKRAHVGKEKAPTKCLGCGATETPEWRRGPLGPRTLCNACGLVHMKLQRKKRKLEEKAAAAAAAGKK